jgi:hypothetical protein
MQMKRLRLKLSRQYEAIIKLLLMAKQGRISLREAHINSADPLIEATLLVEGPPAKILWFMEKARTSPYIKSLEELE